MRSDRKSERLAQANRRSQTEKTGWLKHVKSDIGRHLEKCLRKNQALLRGDGGGVGGIQRNTFKDRQIDIDTEMFAEPNTVEDNLYQTERIKYRGKMFMQRKVGQTSSTDSLSGLQIMYSLSDSRHDMKVGQEKCHLENCKVGNVLDDTSFNVGL